MADVKIPVSASVQNVTNELDKIPAKVDAVSRKINKFKWQVIDLKAVEADLKKLEGMIADFQKRTGGLGLGVGGVPGGQAPAGPLYRPPAGPPAPAGGGGRGGGGRGGPGSHTHAPQWWDIGRNAFSGIGGGFAQIGGYGVRGGLAGYHSGGMPGAGLGLLKGLGIGALAYGAFKVGQGINEGHEMAKERGGSLDTIKRQMGDLGVSFARLKMMSDAAADGLAINSLEAAKLMEQFNRESRGAERSPEGLARSVRTSVGVSKAYGLDPGVGVGFFGGIKGIDPKQDKRELALILAETIERSGMNSRADEVMQVIQSFAATTSRMSLSSPNLSAHAGSYSSLMSMGLPGMTSDVASGILSQSNAALMGMGGAGEAGQNFILAAMQRNGALNPIQAKALAAGGLFATRASVFGERSALGRYFGSDATSLAGGAGANVTNFDAIRTHLAGMGGDKWLQLEGAQRLYGLNSPQQAAAMLMMNSSEFGGLQKVLDRAGVGPGAFTAGGLQTMAKIGVAGSMSDLTQVYAGMRGRTGKGSLSEAEIGVLDRAQATGDMTKFQDALIKIASTKDREETQFTVQQDQKAALEQIQINTGDKLIPIAQGIKDGVTALVEKLAPNSDYLKQQNPAMLGPQKGGASSAWNQTGGATVGWDAPGAAGDDLYSKLLKRESGGRHMVDGKLIESSAGALGISQVMPKTGTSPGFGVKPLQNQSQEEYTRFGRDYLNAMLKRYGGDKAKALAAYNAGPGAVDKAIAEGGANWLSMLPGETQAYVPAILGGTTTQLPSGNTQAGGGRGFVNPSPVEVPLILLPQNQQGQSIGQSATTRVSIPRGAGTAR